MLASASESSQHLNRWFLGLAPDEYDSFVLLCEDTKGNVFRFIAASDFAREMLPKLSTDSAGQIKFHVTRQGGRFYLDVPGTTEASIDSILEKFENL